ncbi:CaiB/BaiF CoA transferase family protein [Bacillus sp. FJAT-45350]|uniref:CaiB/BaiF CoA transferase family protein n=1 Tax=Bacillus sp. FJAT-45350 TaxID=2011014 RepID=UPI000BB797DB|nr:CaiB/BaiF CoA-transferase family protein [Bacillus sp. FJAT-45350]
MLEGIRVIDFSQYLPGPYASLRLADIGAEVIKVEPLSGDAARTIGKKNGVSLLYSANNRNKKSITLNLKEEEGRNIALNLIKKADVVIESFRPGVMERLGLCYEKVKAVNEKIIYCSITGYGQNTAISHFGSHDLNYVALSGTLSQLKDSDGRPVHPTITFADLIGGISASEAIMGALVQRSIKKKGAYLDISLTDVMVSMMNNHVLLADEKEGEQGIAQLSGDVISYHLYETKDGRYMSLAAVEPKFWVNFCHGVGKEEWISSHVTNANEENKVYRQLKKLFKSYTLEEWIHFVQKVDCCLTPVLEIGELKNYPYIIERNLINRSALGHIEVATSYDKEFNESKIEKAPALGEHNSEVLSSVLGLSEEQINQLKSNKII